MELFLYILKNLAVIWTVAALFGGLIILNALHISVSMDLEADGDHHEKN